jgi:hypothetical protein
MSPKKQVSIQSVQIGIVIQRIPCLSIPAVFPGKGLEHRLGQRGLVALQYHGKQAGGGKEE